MRWPREVHEGDVSCHTSSNTTLLGAETWKEFPLHRRVRAAAAADLLREVSIVESDKLKASGTRRGSFESRTASEPKKYR